MPSVEPPSMTMCSCGTVSRATLSRRRGQVARRVVDRRHDRQGESSVRHGTSLRDGSDLTTSYAADYLSSYPTNPIDKGDTCIASPSSPCSPRSSSRSPAPARRADRLSLVAYSTPKAAFSTIIPAFQQTPAGKDVSFTQSYGPSADQAQAVVNGLPADVVDLSLEPDMRHARQGGPRRARRGTRTSTRASSRARSSCSSSATGTRSTSGAGTT